MRPSRAVYLFNAEAQRLAEFAEVADRLGLRVPLVDTRGSETVCSEGGGVGSDGAEDGGRRRLGGGECGEAP
jgi:hypothetical protein